uniref:uncharacterized protein LOC120333035 n=1 Tax=Styela clava TaxID=7725 RepID=UPI00193AAE78|nr:uncharacterized protein LOC120333035 [Styela clava]
MSFRCCLPGCDLTSKDCTLFKIPAKKFLSGSAKEWADKLEKIILGCRQDHHIYNLFQRDMVRMCERHFESSDYRLVGKQKKLNVGAIPSINLPKTKKTEKFVRPPPKIRKETKPIIFRDFNAFKNKASNSTLLENWECLASEHRLTIKKLSEFDQPSYCIRVDNNFKIQILYFGWRGCLGFNIQNNTVLQLLHHVERLVICPGLQHENGIPHLRTKPAENSELSNYPHVDIIAYRLVNSF